MTLQYMGLSYFHLDDVAVRESMLELWEAEHLEIERHPEGRETVAKLLTDAGWTAWGHAMPTALRDEDDEWLRRAMSQPGYWQPFYTRRNRSGTLSRVNYNKHDAVRRLCLSEFNIAYIRGLATELGARGEELCEIYRAGPAAEPRGVCSSWEGTTVPIAQVVAGHRAKYWPPPGDPAAWMLPTGWNCHHSIRAVRIAV